MPILETRRLSLRYRTNGADADVLRDIDLRVEKGEFVCIQGPSGSGKSTLFYVLGCLLRPTGGSVALGGQELTKIPEPDLAMVRSRDIGFIFQQFHLLPRASVLENILLPTLYPAELAGLRSPDDNRRKATALADRLGIAPLLDRLPNELSGGQQQRVAIARSLMNDAKLILADEPTGNLDSVSSRETMDLLLELNAEGRTIVLITHDPEVASRCKRIVKIRDGRILDAGETEAAPGRTEPLPRPASVATAVRGLPGGSVGRLLRASASLAASNLLRSKMRSGLTMLGVVIGVAAVVVVITLGQFTKSKILESYEGLGANRVSLWGFMNRKYRPTDTSVVRYSGFNPARDIFGLKAAFPEILHISPELSFSPNLVSHEGNVVVDGVGVVGVSEEYFDITNRVLRNGQRFSAYHIENRSAVCILGSEIARQFFANTSGLGEVVTISARGMPSFTCRVLATLQPQASYRATWNPDLSVLIPYTYHQAVVPAHLAAIQQMQIQLERNADPAQVAEQIQATLRGRFGRSAIFVVDSGATLASQISFFLMMFSGFLISVALLCAAVGGIGINNMMLASVNDRLREFGLRKALGATNQAVRYQVITESCLLCGAAGAIGVLLGIVCYQLIIYVASRLVPGLPFEWVILPTAILGSTLVVALLGILSGLFPALKAERLQVIEAMRSE